MKNFKDSNKQNNDRFDENGYFIEEVDGKRANLPTEKIIKEDNNTKEPKIKNGLWKEILKTIVLLTLVYYGLTYFPNEEKRKVNTIIPSTSNQAIYTFYGEKDRRITATYYARYISTEINEECSSTHLMTGNMRPSLLSSSETVPDGKYEIDFPIFLEYKYDKNKCGYKFQTLNLTMTRDHIPYLSSMHTILSDKNKSDITYFRTKGGSGGSGGNIEDRVHFFTNKKYFQIADGSNFLCRTRWYEFSQDDSFHCVMKIRDGKGANSYIRSKSNPKSRIVTHPEFGVDTIKSTRLEVNIIADDNGSTALLYKHRGKDAYNVYGNRKRGEVNVPYPFQTIKENKLKTLYNKIFNNKE